jgi:acetyl esterase/lipase
MSEITRRDFVLSGLTAGIAASVVPENLRAAMPLDSTSAITDPYALVDPELRPALNAFPTLTFNAQMLPTARKEPALPARPAPAPQAFERRIPGPPGAPELRLVMVDPEPGKKGRPAFLHIHGGGYIAGFAGHDPAFLQTVAQNCKCLVVSVNYRLAPETHFPGSLEDTYTALRWIYHNADELGVDRKRIGIGGESAGGGHSAQLAIAARDRREIPVLFQLLIYPMLDDRTGSTRPVPPHIGKFIWIAESNRFGWTSLLGVPAGSADVPAGAVPSRVENLAGLPPTFISVGAIDLFVDEDVEYARRLINAGVPTELHVTPGAYHGYDLLAPDAAASRRFTESWTAALNRAFGNA